MRYLLPVLWLGSEPFSAMRRIFSDILAASPWSLTTSARAGPSLIFPSHPHLKGGLKLQAAPHDVPTLGTSPSIRSSLGPVEAYLRTPAFGISCDAPSKPSP